MQRTGAALLCRQAEKVGAVQPGKEKVLWKPHRNSPVLKGPVWKLERDSSSGTTDGTKSNGHKLKEGKLRLDIRRRFFTVRVARHWHRLPRNL